MRHHVLYSLAIALVLATVAISDDAFAQTAASAPATAPAASGPLLGSPDFKPSTERPIGWRGDWTGRFPGATPPTTWSRRLKGITSEIVAQATKPTDEPGADSQRLAYWTVKDWLVVGPFPATDPEKDIDKDFLGGEATVQPTAGDKTGPKDGEAAWKVHRASEGTQARHDYNTGTGSHHWVDFVYAFGKLAEEAKTVEIKLENDLDNKVAYAHTYLYAPKASDVGLEIIHNTAAVKLWLNGKPEQIEPNKPFTDRTLQVHLNQGWNRLLVKVICTKATGTKSGEGTWPPVWRFAAYIKPPKGASALTYETQNIAWMTKLTGRSMSQPIVVGDRVFVGSGISDFFCLDKTSGKVVWLRTGTAWDAMTTDERSPVKDKIEPMLAELDKANAELVTMINAGVSPQGLSSTGRQDLDRKLKDRRALEMKLHDALAIDPKLKNKGKLYMNEVSSSNATPVSDGKQVYWVCGGAWQAGCGGFLITAFDLDGKRVWSRLEADLKPIEHGIHSSPALCEGKLIVNLSNLLLAVDAVTGKELWRRQDCNSMSGANTPILVQVGGKRAIQTQTKLIGLEGDVLAQGGFSPWCCYTPVVEDGVLYNCARMTGWKNDFLFDAVDIPAQTGPEAKQKILWSLDGKSTYGAVFDWPYYVASPLFVDGIVYQVSGFGQLIAVDTVAQKLAYRRWLDGYNRTNRYLYGTCASPTLAGKRIYMVDGAGYTCIIEPGSVGKEIAHNILENITPSSNNPCNQECFYAGMYFEGNRLFLHGDEYLYCISEK